MTNKEIKDLHGKLSGAVLLFAILLSFYAAWAAVQLWAWFVVPAFELPPLSIPLVFGLRVLLTLLHSVPVPPAPTPATEDAAWESAVNRVVMMAVTPTAALVIGSIARGFL